MKRSPSEQTVNHRRVLVRSERAPLRPRPIGPLLIETPRLLEGEAELLWSRPSTGEVLA